MFTSYTEASIEAMHNLRNASHFQWFLVPLLAFVVYAYVVEAERKNWNIFVTGIAFLGGEFLWEMFNALILRWTKHSAMWTTPGRTAYLILVGLTIEICMMFSVAGVIFTKALPADKKRKILGIPNRVVCVIAFGVGCVLVECVLNSWGVLVWEYPWWRWPNIWLIILAYCGGFYLCAWFYDLEVSIRKKALMTAGLYLVVLVCVVVFIWTLKWI